MGLIVVVAAAVGVWLAVNSSSPGEYPAPGPVTVQEAHELIRDHADDPDFVVLDVRTASEFRAGHLATGEARILNVDIDSASFRGRIDQLDRTDKYLVYCRTGNRSEVAVEYMQDAGFDGIYHMDRGIVPWEAAGLPLVAE